MVSTVRFPNFKKVSPKPWVRRWITIAFIGLLCLLIVFPRDFFVGFFAVYILMGLALNLAWMFGWRGVLPPQKIFPRAEEETEETVH